MREVENKQAEMEAKVVRLEAKRLDAERKREEYEDKTIFGKVWAWIVWISLCGRED